MEASKPEPLQIHEGDGDTKYKLLEQNKQFLEQMKDSLLAIIFREKTYYILRQHKEYCSFFDNKPYCKEITVDWSNCKSHEAFFILMKLLQGFAVEDVQNNEDIIQLYYMAYYIGIKHPGFLQSLQNHINYQAAKMNGTELFKLFEASHLRKDETIQTVALTHIKAFGFKEVLNLNLIRDVSFDCFHDLLKAHFEAKEENLNNWQSDAKYLQGKQIYQLVKSYIQLPQIKLEQDKMMKLLKLSNIFANTESKDDQFEVRLGLLELRYEEDINSLQAKVKSLEEKNSMLQQQMKYDVEELQASQDQIMHGLQKISKNEEHLDQQLKILQKNISNTIKNGSELVLLEQKDNESDIDYSVYRLILTKDEKYILSTDSKSVLHLIDFASQNLDEIKQVKAHEEKISALLELTPTTVITSSWDKTMCIWKIPSLEKLETIQALAKIKALIQLQDLSLLSSSDDNKLKVWKTDDQNKLALKQEQAFQFEFSNKALLQLKSGLICTGGVDGKALIVDIGQPEFKTVSEVKLHSQYIYVFLEMQENVILSGSHDRRIQMFNTTGQILHTFLGHTHYLATLLKLTDNVFVSGSEKEIKVWELKDKSCIQDIKDVGYTIIQSKDKLVSGRDNVCWGIFKILKASVSDNIQQV